MIGIFDIMHSAMHSAQVYVLSKSPFVWRIYLGIGGGGGGGDSHIKRTGVPFRS